MKTPLLKELKEGVALLPLVKHISQDKINYFSVISDAAEAVHVDPEFAAKSPMKTTLANGFMSFGYICELMENNFGLNWMLSGEVELKFIGAVRPGDSVVAQGVIEEIAQTDGGLLLSCKVRVVNQEGRDCVIGYTSLTCVTH